MELEKLEARLQYESGSAPPLALVSVEEVAVDLTVRPNTLNATASLGNLRAQDGILPEVGTQLRAQLPLLDEQLLRYSGFIAASPALKSGQSGSNCSDRGQMLHL